MDLLTQVPIGIIRVFHLNSSDGRKDIHNYLNNFHPKLKHVGLLCKCFPFDDKTYFKCYNCKSLILLEYHRGIENNNIDEYMSGVCENCDESIHWEPNFDSRSRVRYIEHHNVIAISDWFKGYNSSPYHQNLEKDKISITAIAQILSKIDHYDIEIPTTRLNKKKLGDYISRQIQSNKINVIKS